MYDFAHCGSCRLQRELRLIRSSWVVRRRRRLLSAQYWARLLKKVLGPYQYHPIPASIGQYLIPQYRYRSNPRYCETDRWLLWISACRVLLSIIVCRFSITLVIVTPFLAASLVETVQVGQQSAFCCCWLCRSHAAHLSHRNHVTLHIVCY